MLSNQDKAYFFDFLGYFESVKKDVKNKTKNFHFKDSNVQNFLTQNRIYVGTFSTHSNNKYKESGYRRFLKMETVSGYEIMRHIRNAIAHGNIQYASNNVLKISDYAPLKLNLTMKACIRRDLLISLIDEIKKTYR